jgi:hypothetical protein
VIGTPIWWDLVGSQLEGKRLTRRVTVTENIASVQSANPIFFNIKVALYILKTRLKFLLFIDLQFDH